MWPPDDKKEPQEIDLKVFLRELSRTEVEPQVERQLYLAYEFDIPKEVAQLTTYRPEGAYVKLDRNSYIYFLHWKQSVWPEENKIIRGYQLACIPFFFLGEDLFIVYSLRQRRWFDLRAKTETLTNPQKTMESSLKVKRDK